MQKFKRFCDFCGKYYEGYGKHYCSNECRQKASRKQIEFNCKFCGNLVSRSASIFKHDNPTYCSHECFYNDVRKNKVLNRAERKILNCINCNKEIIIIGYDINVKGNKKKKYCSVKCMDEHRKSWIGELNPRYEQDKHIEKKCLWCEKSFIIHKCKTKRNRGDGNFCSKECSGAYTIRYKQNRISKIENEFAEKLKTVGIDFIHQAKIGKFVADFYLPNINTIIEFDGEYWHSIPKVIEKDKRKEKYYLQNNYKLIRVHEREYINDSELTIKTVIKKINAFK